MTVCITMGINRTKYATKIPPVMAAVAMTSVLQAILQLPGVEMIQPLPTLMSSIVMPSLPSPSELAHLAAVSAIFVRQLAYLEC